ncbi:MAG TPA: ATP-binding cassette domain-containing protein, partial [Plasticicumulans sp.]|nr:ATP-binding cassette domain-containing protein [Plasticicumulans sp.]
MLKLQSLTLRRGTRPLFEQVSLTIFPGQRVGVTGANGTGKSSLFALLRGELHADSGDVQMPPKWVIAHVAQETPGVDSAAIDYALDGDAELREVEAALAAAEADPEHCGLKLGELHARYEAIGGWG